MYRVGTHYNSHTLVPSWWARQGNARTYVHIWRTSQARKARHDIATNAHLYRVGEVQCAVHVAARRRWVQKSGLVSSTVMALSDHYHPSPIYCVRFTPVNQGKQAIRMVPGTASDKMKDSVWRCQVPYHTIPMKDSVCYFPIKLRLASLRVFRSLLLDRSGSSTPTSPGCACMI